jgi:uncharacterized membrane protein YsdA (DUF1294 family)
MSPTTRRRRTTTATDRRARRPRPWALAAGLLTAAAGTVALHELGWSWFPAWLLTLGLVTLAVFGLDKLQARRGGERISETALLGLSLCGGSLGALLAMSLFRHKTSKRSFRLAFAGVVVAQIGLFFWWWTVFREAGTSS